VLFCCILSIFVGSISALYQKRVKRLFAFSTIAHTGFILLAILACSIDSAKSLIFYVVIYAFFNNFTVFIVDFCRNVHNKLSKIFS
jgi:NADH-quinone oxidoreductase subunit N